MDSEKGLFVQMPQRAFKRGEGETEYTDVFHPVTADARAAINESVMAAFYGKDETTVTLPEKKITSMEEWITSKPRQTSFKIDQLVNKEGSHLKAFASATIGGAFAVHGIRVMDSEKGLFVQMPQRAFKRGEGEIEYSDVFHPITAEAREAINEGVMAAYTAKVKELSGEKDHAAKAANTHKARKSAPER